MNDQNLYAALELTDHEVRLAVGQFHNQRLNVLKVERVTCSGFLNQTIIDPKAVAEALRLALTNASKNLGVNLNQVILALPSASMTRINRKVTIEVQGRIGGLDLQRAVKTALKEPIPETLEIVNVVINKSIVNGISLRRLPIDEACDSFTADIDLLCADKAVVYAYAGIVEKAGVRIAEISLDGFAIGKEASLFEKSQDHYIVLLKLERQSTSLSLFAKGKLVSTEVLDEGSSSMISAIAEKHHLPMDVADRLLHYNVRLGLEKYPKTPIYLWSDDDRNHTLTEHDVAQLIEPKLDAWLQSVHQAISPLLESEGIEIVLSGASGDINGLAETVSRQLGIPASVYVSETLGLRQAALSVVAGLFYAVKDQSAYRAYESAVDLELFSAKIKTSMGKNSPEDTLGNKFRNIFEKSKN